MFQSGPDLRRIDKCLSGLKTVQSGSDLRRTVECRAGLGMVQSGSDPRRINECLRDLYMVQSVPDLRWNDIIIIIIYWGVVVFNVPLSRDGLKFPYNY